MLKQRIITALILAPLVLCGLFLLEPGLFAVFVAFVTVLGAWEWANLSGLEHGVTRWGYPIAIAGVLFLTQHADINLVLLSAIVWWIFAFVLVLAYPNLGGLWQSVPARLVIGLFVLVPFWKALVFIREAEIALVPELSVLWVILYLLLLVWSADVGAYFAGKTWGKAKLAPNVSPGKSWAGAWGGLASVGVLALIAAALLELSVSDTLILVLASLFAGIISIIGDLSESMFKRYRGIKDSSNLLPGHGGVMDRIDSLTAAVPVLTFIFVAMGWMS